MGKKGRPKPKAKQTGKKRPHGKRTSIKDKAVYTARKLLKHGDDDYLANRADYEPIRKDDSDEVEDDEMDEGDLEVFNQPDMDFKFLTAVNLEKDPKLTKKKRKLFANSEELYEKLPRLAGEEWQPKQHLLLPLKDKSGVIRPNASISENGDSNKLVNDTEMSSTTNTENCLSKTEVNGHFPENIIPLGILSAVELLKIRQENINAKKVLITDLVSAILEDPSANIKKLNEMNQLCEEKDSDVSVTVRKLAIVSQLEVFKDIIPGYHIRPLSESEKSTKVSKDVKKVRIFEAGLLNGYQKYLDVLEHAAKHRERKRLKGSKRLDRKDLSMIALNCLCDLLISVPHFNYRTNIMAVLVPMMNNKSADGQVSKLCCQTIHTIFKNDYVGDISLEIVQLVNKYVKSQSFNVKPCVLETFLSLRIQDADLNKKDKGIPAAKSKHKNRLDKANKKRISKNDRKRQKELKKIELELQEAEAVEGKGKSIKLSKRRPLLRDQSRSKSVGESLNIDPQTFYSHLYSTLLNISPASTDTDISTALECLDVMLNKRRKQVSIQRLLAYIKRLCTLALQQCPSTALALLACVRSFLQMDNKAEIILDSGGSGGGIFRPEIPNPEYANADGTSLWELCIFHRHYEQTLRNFAINISLGNPSQGRGSLPAYLARKNPLELFEGTKEHQQLFAYLKNKNCLDRTVPKRQKIQHNNLPADDTWFQKCVEKDVNHCFVWMEKQEKDVNFAKSFVSYA